MDLKPTRWWARGASVVLAAAAAGGCVGVIGDGSEGRDGAPSVDVSPLRRLTRSQYSHTVRDLLAIGGDPGSKLEADEKIGPFFSNAIVPVSELLAEQYMRVAEDLAAQAELTSIVPCDPLVDGETTCGAAFVEQFGLKAFRRPLGSDERQAMVTLFEQGRAQEGFEAGIRLVIEALLQSPQFLYHLEFGLPPVGGEDVVALDPYELASRLSYFLWDSMPDDELLRAAGAGELSSAESIGVQAKRMLADPKAADAIASFHVQWLDLDRLTTLEKNATVYPGFDATLRVAMAAETARFVDYVIRKDDGRLETLLTAPYSMLEGPLFELYGVVEPSGHDPAEPIALDPTERAGLLTHASVLATHAHADQSSPVRRGKLIREHLMCHILDPPPPNVDVTPPELDPEATTRERFEQHRAEPACAACHQLIDPLGFGFEHYDGMGAYRSEEGGEPVDASGEIVASDDIDGPFDGAIELAQILAESEQVRNCIAQQWFTFGLGRASGAHDARSYQAAYDAFAASGYGIRELLVALVMTDSFRYRRLEESSP
ncbi:MAG TPA: DUF1592 domain-containing protein [Polyangiaceae bacterium]|nr:DUF1592 domain-containing protein [Polyangiaceae bacterium]